MASKHFCHFLKERNQNFTKNAFSSRVSSEVKKSSFNKTTSRFSRKNNNSVLGAAILYALLNHSRSGNFANTTSSYRSPHSQNIKKSTTEWADTLGINPTATAETIRNAYRTMAKTVHPDVGGSTEQFMKVHNAYEEGMSKFQ